MTYVPLDGLNRHFVALKKVAFSVDQEAENDFKVPFDNLNHRSFDFIQIAFLAGQVAENEFTVHKYQKNGFIDFTQVAFWAGPEAQKLVERAMRVFETTLSRPQQSRILGW